MFKSVKISPDHLYLYDIELQDYVSKALGANNYFNVVLASSLHWNIFGIEEKSRCLKRGYSPNKLYQANMVAVSKSHITSC